MNRHMNRHMNRRMNGLGVLPAFAWDGETMAIREFRGDFQLSDQRELSVRFGSEQAGGSFRRSETQLSGGLTPFLTAPLLPLAVALRSTQATTIIASSTSAALPCLPHRTRSRFASEPGCSLRSLTARDARCRDDRSSASERLFRLTAAGAVKARPLAPVSCCQRQRCGDLEPADHHAQPAPKIQPNASF
jgi:hypothetical protein